MLQRLDQLLTPRRQSYAWIAGGAMWIGWLVSLMLGPGNMDLAGHLIGTDFVAFYSAGKILLIGRPEALYDLELARSIQSEIYGYPSPNFNPYLNPPFYAGYAAPFALLPYPYSPILWMVLGVAALWFSLRLLELKTAGRVFLLALSWMPAFAAVTFGQNTFFSLLVLCLAYVGWKNGRFFTAGLVSSLLLYKPQLLLGVGLLWLLEWRTSWRALLGMAFGGAITLGLNLWLLPEATWAYLTYGRQVAANLITLEGFPNWNAFAVQSFWLMLLPGSRLLAQSFYILCTLIGLWCFYRFWRQQRSQPALLYAAAICLTVWATPYIMVYDWALLLLPAVLIWQTTSPGLRRVWRPLFAILWVATFLSGPLTFVQLQFLPFAVQIAVPGLFVVLLQAQRALSPVNQP